MTLNKKMQIGLLFTLYLARSGKTTVGFAAEGLRVSEQFLCQIARDLRLAKVVKSTRGTNGGYELNGQPTVRDVFNALSPVSFLSSNDKNVNATGGHERRTLNHLAFNLTMALKPLMDRKVASVGMDLTASDAAMLKRLPETTRPS